MEVSGEGLGHHLGVEELWLSGGTAQTGLAVLEQAQVADDLAGRLAQLGALEHLLHLLDRRLNHVHHSSRNVVNVVRRRADRTASRDVGADAVAGPPRSADQKGGRSEQGQAQDHQGQAEETGEGEFASR